jgi:hypothetical protein
VNVVGVPDVPLFVPPDGAPFPPTPIFTVYVVPPDSDSNPGIYELALTILLVNVESFVFNPPAPPPPALLPAPPPPPPKAKYNTLVKLFIGDWIVEFPVKTKKI